MRPLIHRSLRDFFDGSMDNSHNIEEDDCDYDHEAFANVVGLFSKSQFTRNHKRFAGSKQFDNKKIVLRQQHQRIIEFLKPDKYCEGDVIITDQILTCAVVKGNLIIDRGWNDKYKADQHYQGHYDIGKHLPFLKHVEGNFTINIHPDGLRGTQTKQVPDHWHRAMKLVVPTLRSVSGDFHITGNPFSGCSGLREVDLPNLRSVGQQFTIGAHENVERINLPRLETVGTKLDISCIHQNVNLNGLTTLGAGGGIGQGLAINGGYWAGFDKNGATANLVFPNLKEVNGAIDLRFDKIVKTISFPVLTKVNVLQLINTQIEVVNFPKLKNIGDVSIYHCLKLQHVKMPAVRRLGHNFKIPYTSRIDPAIKNAVDNIEFTFPFGSVCVHQFEEANGRGMFGGMPRGIRNLQVAYHDATAQEHSRLTQCPICYGWWLSNPDSPHLAKVQREHEKCCARFAKARQDALALALPDTE